VKLKKALWPIVAIFAVFALGFVTALAMRPRPVAVEVRTGPSAATSITIFLLVVLGVMAGLAVSAFLTWQALRAYQQTKRLKQVALLFGAKSAPSTPRRPRPAVGAGSDGRTVVVIGNSTPYVEDLR